ncbi:hypothetical protein BC940DRAFT_301919 [Gongronella butleri]|nr:hypothetical protein BC940DRAFT_301919 [Gongronella butleri]
MEWSRLEGALQQQEPSAWLTHSVTLMEDFGTLLKLLKACRTVSDCAGKYPQAGRLLTKASMHPLIGTTKTLTRLVAKCVLEYTKYDFSGTMTATGMSIRARAWCIRRLQNLGRSTLITHPTTDRTISRNVDTLKKRLNERLKKHTMTDELMQQVGDRVFLVWCDDRAKDGVDAVLDAAIEWQALKRKRQQRDPEWTETRCTCFSEAVVQHLISPAMQTVRRYRNLAFRCKLWRAIPEVFEWEWMDLMDDQCEKELSDHLKMYRASSDHPNRYDRSPALILGVQLTPSLFYASLCIVASLLKAGCLDWRMMCIWQQVRRVNFFHEELHSDLPLSLSRLVTVFAELEKNAPSSFHSRFFMAHVQDLMDAIATYIYADSSGSLDERRNLVWLLAALFPHCLYRCASICFAWCQSYSAQPIQELQPVIRFLTWLIYPSLNPCVAKSTLIQAWLTSLQGFDTMPIHVVALQFMKHGRVVLDLHPVVGVECLLAMIDAAPSWSDDDCSFLVIRNRPCKATKTGIDAESV